MHAGRQGLIDLLNIEGRADDPADLCQERSFAPPSQQGFRRLMLLGDISIGHQGTALVQRLHLHLKPTIRNIFIAIRIGLKMVRPAPRGHGEDAVG